MFERIISGADKIRVENNRIAQATAPSPDQAPHVAVLLCTHNGESFISEQLQSIGRQSHSNWSLWVSDDNSDDTTLQEIDRFANAGRMERVHVLKGPGEGFVANFLSLVCNPAIEADYFAFCDQDDVWLDQKLETAIEALSRYPAAHPAAYFGRTRIIDAHGRAVGLSPLFDREPALENALVQSIGGGNTTVINRAARDVLRMAGEDLDVAAHDWWTYLAVSACGGTVIYDAIPQVEYRQHGNNIIGENSSLPARLLRLHLLLRGRFSSWIEGNLAALSRLAPLIPPQNQAVISEFIAVRQNRSMLARAAGLYRLGLYRQTLFGNVSLYLAALLGKW